VREVFALYLAHYSALAIAHILNDRQLPARARARKTTPTAGAWSKAAVLRALQNPIYIGKIPYRDEVFDGEHEAIIDPEIFAQVQQLLAHPQTTRIRHPEDTFMLRGLVKCACCHACFTPATGKRSHDKTYRYYRCTSRDRHGAKACPSKPLPAQALEDFVVEQVRTLLCQEPMLSDVHAATRLRLATETEALHKDNAQLPEAIAAHAARLQVLASQPQTPAISPLVEQTAAALEQLRAQLERNTRRLSALQHAEVDLRWVHQTLSRFDDCWAALNPANQQRLLRGLISEITVNEPDGVLHVRLLPWVTQASAQGDAA
jgi:site-specific DNA recombinase